MKHLLIILQKFLSYKRYFLLSLSITIISFAEEENIADKNLLSEEEILLQSIEPNFKAKDERALQWIMLNKVIRESEEKIKAGHNRSNEIRNLFSQKYRDDLSKYVEKNTAEPEVNYKKISNEVIAYFEHALSGNPDHPIFAANALYNLGRLYFEKDEEEYFVKLSAYNKGRDEGREDLPYPEEDFQRTINVYDTLMQKFPNFALMDNVYYLHALALWYEGQFYAALESFQSLIRKFPDSRFVEETWFRLGEYFYDMDEFEEAIRAYEHVVKNPQSKLYNAAIYKIAWSYFQKNRFRLAIENFVKVLDLTSPEESQASASGMRAEVVRYIVKSFREELVFGKIAVNKNLNKEEKAAHDKELGMGLVSRIESYFATKKSPYVRDIFIETASQLVDDAKVDGAVSALNKILKLDPKHTDNSKIQAQIVDIFQEAGRLEEARQQNHKLMQVYSKDSEWSKALKDDHNALKIAKEAVRDAMLALAVYYHRIAKEAQEEAKESEASTNYSKAAFIYSRYVREYPERDDVHKAIFYYAESLYELKRYRPALDAYLLLKEYPLPIPEPFRRDATYNIVFTFRHVLEREAVKKRFKEIDFDNLTSKQRGLEEEPIPKVGEQYLKSIDEFLLLAPQDEQVPVLLFHAAAIYYVYGYADESLKRFFYIIDTYPATPAASVAGRLVIDDAISKEDWVRVAELSKRFGEQNLGGQKSDFTKMEGNARFKIARSIFEEANTLHKNNQINDAKEKYKQSAELFAALIKEDPTSPYADIMLFNTARAVLQSGTIAEALPLYRRLYTEYPRSEYAKTARFQEALALEKMLKFTEAAKAYDGIVKEDPKSEAAADAMLNKALLYEAAGELSNAANAFTEFAKKYPNRVEAPAALLTTATIYKKMGRTNQQIAMLEQFIKQYKNDLNKRAEVIEANVHIGDTYAELIKQSGTPVQKNRYDKERLAHYKTAVSLFSHELDSPLAAFYAAKAQLILEKPEQESFKKMKINARLGKAQSEQLTAMMKKLSELSQKNENIIKTYAQPVWNAESLLRIGDLYVHLANTMISAPCPRDVEEVDEFACDEYTVLLEDKAAVLEEKALSAYKQAYEIAMSAYDTPAELVDSIQRALNGLRPGEYQKVGNVIEQPTKGSFDSRSRMLSTGQMSYSLHPKESDPDIFKAPENIEPPEDVKKEEDILLPINEENEEEDL